MTKERTVGKFLITITEMECYWCEQEKRIVLGGMYGDALPTCLDCAKELVAVLGGTE